MLQIVRFGEYEWVVIHYFGDEFTVKIDGNHCSCTCNIPLLQHLPCAHVMAACSAVAKGAKRAHHDFASNWYTVQSYHAAYTPEFHPVRDKRYWPQPSGPMVFPPQARRAPGRPKSTRIKGTMDEGQSSRSNRCSKCGVNGHKKSRCTTVT